MHASMERLSRILHFELAIPRSFVQPRATRASGVATARSISLRRKAPKNRDCLARLARRGIPRDRAASSEADHSARIRGMKPMTIESARPRSALLKQGEAPRYPRRRVAQLGKASRGIKKAAGEKGGQKPRPVCSDIPRAPREGRCRSGRNRNTAAPRRKAKRPPRMRNRGESSRRTDPPFSIRRTAVTATTAEKEGRAAREADDRRARHRSLAARIERGSRS